MIVGQLTVSEADEVHRRTGDRVVDKAHTLDEICVTREPSSEPAFVDDAFRVVAAPYDVMKRRPGSACASEKAADFERFAGQKIKVKTVRMLDPDQRGKSRKTFTGELLGLAGDMVRIELDDKRGGLATIAMADLEQANLVEDF